MTYYVILLKTVIVGTLQRRLSIIYILEENTNENIYTLFTPVLLYSSKEVLPELIFFLILK